MEQEQELAECMDLLRKLLPADRRSEYGFTKCSKCFELAYFIPCVAEGKLDVACDTCNRVFCDHEIKRCNHCGAIRN